MKNWLSKNKYKIIILPVVLLVGIFLGGCSDGKADSPDIITLEAPNTASIAVDNDTGVEYIVVKRGINVYGITPRLNSDGKPMSAK